MKTYPSIKRFRRDRHLDFCGETFAKIDGSNLRFEWEKKRGWFRFGSRRRLLNDEHETFGEALQMFLDGFAEQFEKTAVNQKWSGVVVYCEFWGEHSFAGEHEPDDQKFLTPIDIAIYKKGVLESAHFVRLFDQHFDLKYLGKLSWNEDFVCQVEEPRFDGMAFEGVVGKNGLGHDRLAIKLKSKAWVDKVIQRYGTEKGQKIIES